jgi:hypothetical protein
MKEYGGVELQVHSFLPSAVGVREWLTSRYGLTTPRERTSYVHLVWGWVESETGVENEAEKTFRSPRTSKDDLSVVLA